MKIGEKEYTEVQVIGPDNSLVASITDEDVIECAGYEVVCVPKEN